MKSNNFTAEILLLFLVIRLNITAQNRYNFTPINEKVTEKKADSILALMNLDEKLLYIGGYNNFILLR